MYKQIISCLLTVAMLISNSSFVFAQNGRLKNKDGKVADICDKYISEDEPISYKPAISFDYDYYNPESRTGKDLTIYKCEFNAKLKQDMYDNYRDTKQEDDDEQDSLDPKSAQRNRVKKAYNDLLYYNCLPEESPYYKWTAFEPDNEATENDVLLILQKHKEISQEISELFKKDPKYQRERQNKITLWVAGGFVLTLMSFYLWELIPSVGAAASTGSTGAAVKMAGVSKFLLLFAIDILSTDSVAYTLRNLEGLKEKFDDIDIYTSTTIENVEDRNMLKSQIESNETQICAEAKENYSNAKNGYVATNGNPILVKEMKKWENILKFCNGKKGLENDKDFRLSLGQYLISAYENRDAKEDIDYVRKEMLHIYYSLLFIKAELEYTGDRLRFDRAMIDLITSYKIANVTITDGRLIKLFADPQNKTQMEVLKDKGIPSKYFNEKVDDERDTLGNKLSWQYSTYCSYPEVLPRSQLNFLVQQLDIYYNIPYQEEIKIKDEQWQRYWNEQLKNNPYGIPK